MLFESDSYILGNKTEDVSCQTVGIQHAHILPPLVYVCVQDIGIECAGESIERWKEHIPVRFFTFQQDTREGRKVICTRRCRRWTKHHCPSSSGRSAPIPRFARQCKSSRFSFAYVWLSLKQCGILTVQQIYADTKSLASFGVDPSKPSDFQIGRPACRRPWSRCRNYGIGHSAY